MIICNDFIVCVGIYVIQKDMKQFQSFRSEGNFNINENLINFVGEILKKNCKVKFLRFIIKNIEKRESIYFLESIIISQVVYWAVERKRCLVFIFRRGLIVFWE